MAYNYTKSRVPVAATYSGPGPCYGLPTLTGHSQHDPRSVHNRGPAYQFGTVHATPRDPCSPGPAHFPDPKVLRTGRNEQPGYTIYPRLAELEKFKVPAPGTYTTVPMSITDTRSPAYSFGLNCPPIEGDQTPGPNVYNPNKKFGQSIESNKVQAPSYSMYGRSKTGGFDEDFKKTPGPAKYAAVETDKYKTKRPQYSLTGRNMMPGDPTQKPGPGAHNPKSVNVNKKMAPCYSFGIRHSDYLAPLIVCGVD